TQKDQSNTQVSPILPYKNTLIIDQKREKKGKKASKTIKKAKKFPPKPPLRASANRFSTPKESHL
ncbi:MAG TPA: hypothetical protein PLP05_09990, partial [Sedimentisphaerales bacterium]|nr:hypothetical protein [Sedimentisphaerales bacterium]